MIYKKVTQSLCLLFVLINLGVSVFACELSGQGSCLTTIAPLPLSNKSDFRNLKLDKISPIFSKYAELKKVRAEAFLSHLLYLINDDTPIGSTFYYGKGRSVVLLDFANDNITGFNAGFFKTNEGKVIIVYGGTFSNGGGADKEIILNQMSDVIIDLNLLNQNYIHPQLPQAIDFINKSEELITFLGKNDNDVTITGHSLGGGLAQFVALYSGYQAVTFNTAPVPISDLSIAYLPSDFKKNKTNIINIMSANDPLTSVLEGVESYAKSQIQGSGTPIFPQGFRYDVYWSPTLNSALKYVDTRRKYINKVGDKLKIFQSPENPLLELLKNKISEDVQFSHLHNSMLDPSYDENTKNVVIVEMLRVLKAKDLKGVVETLMPIYGFNNTEYSKLEELIYGERIILWEAKTNHSILDLILKVFDKPEIYNISQLNDLLKIRFPDVPTDYIFYDYIEELANKKIINGSSSLNFEPEEMVKKGQFYKMVSLYLLGQNWSVFNANQTKRDPNNWNALSWEKRYSYFLKEYAKDKAGFFSEYEFEKFLSLYPLDFDLLNLPIARKEVVANINMVIFGERGERGSTLNFRSSCNIANDWSEDSIVLQRYGIINGNPVTKCFDKNSLISRGELSKILVRTNDWIKNNK